MARRDGKDRGLFQRAGDSAWWIRWRCPYGHEHMEKIGPKGLAKTEYQKRRVAVKTQGFCLTQARHAKPTLFRDAARRYLGWARPEYPRSITFREKALKHLLAAFGDRTLAALTREDVERYQAQRREAGAAPGTVNRERSVLSHLFTKANTWRLVQGNPVTGTARQKEPDERPRPLTPAEEARLLAGLPTGKRAWPYWRALVALAIHTGLRLNEIRQQAWEDVDLAAGTLRVSQPKSGKNEELPLNTTIRAVLAALERSGPRLFPTLPKKLSDVFIRYAKRAGLRDVTFHCLRDTYISRLAPHVSTPTLMALARHRDYRTTRRYVRLDGEHLRAAVERLNPEGTVTDTVTPESGEAKPLDSADTPGEVE